MAFSVRATGIAVAIVLAFLYGTWTFLGWRWALVSGAAWTLFGLWVSTDELLDTNASLAAMHKRGLNTQRYNKNEVPDNLDAIVIGSGMGGMSCAALLARLGRKVLVLEQHEMTGGGTHMYELGPSGKYKFDSGLHYVVPYSGLLLHILTGGPRPLIRFPKVGDSTGTFDEVVFVTGNDQTEKFAIKHNEGHLPELYKQFPKEKAEIDRFMQVSESVMLKFPIWLLSKLCPMWLQKIIFNTILSKFIHYCGRGTMDVLNEITENNRLKSLLCSLWIDTGCPPDIATFMLSACVIRGLPHEGGAYPAGGSDLMSRSLIPVIERAGGRVLCRAFVEKVIVGPNGATGVRLANGDEISAPLVVSAIGYPNTQKIVDDDAKSRFGVPASIPVKSSLGFVMANIGLKGSAADLNLTCKNLWVHPVPDCKTDKGCDLMAGWHSFCKRGSMTNPPSPSELPAWITFPSMKDRDWALTHPDSTTCQILVMTPYEWWDREDWKSGKSGSRGAEYEQIKQKWKDQCVSLLLRFYPHFKEKIELVDLSTPLTIEHYLREPKGGAIGLDVSPNRFADPDCIAALDMKTKVPGLWMTGQDTLLCGQPMVQIAGVLTALRIVGITGGVKFAAYGLRSLAQWLLTTPPTPAANKKTN